MSLSVRAARVGIQRAMIPYLSIRKRCTERSVQLSDAGFEQRPGSAAELLLPARIKFSRQLCPEACDIRPRELHSALREFLLESAIQLRRVRALAADLPLHVAHDEPP